MNKFEQVFDHMFSRFWLGILFFFAGWISNEIHKMVNTNWYHHAFGMVGTLISMYVITYLIGHIVVLVNRWANR